MATLCALFRRLTAGTLVIAGFALHPLGVSAALRLGVIRLFYRYVSFLTRLVFLSIWNQPTPSFHHFLALTLSGYERSIWVYRSLAVLVSRFINMGSCRKRLASDTSRMTPQVLFASVGSKRPC